MRFLTLDPEKVRSSAPASLYVELGETRWFGKMLQTGGLVIERPEDHYDVVPLDPSFLTNHYGVDMYGGIYPIRRTYTAEELRVAIPRIAELFGLKLVKGGLGVGGGKLAWGNPTTRQFFQVGRRQILFNASWYGSGIEAPPPVLQFDQNGDVLFPMGMMVACLLRWGELIPEQGKRFMENHPMRGYKDRLSARLTNDSVNFMWARRYGEGYYV